MRNVVKLLWYAEIAIKRFTDSEWLAELTITEPYTPRGVCTVPGEGGVNLSSKYGKATLLYSTIAQVR